MPPPSRRRADPAAVDAAVADVLAALDAAAARGEAAELDAEVTRIAVRGLADRLAAAVPGRAVELRVVDPALRIGVAVQCVPGVRHTRGTPPNVVELGSAADWIRLATGRAPWAELVATGR